MPNEIAHIEPSSAAQVSTQAFAETPALVPSPAQLAKLSVRTSATTGKLFMALALAQSLFEVPVKDKEVQVTPRDGGRSYTFRYATHASLQAAARPGLTAAKIAVIQPFSSRDNRMFLLTIVAHEDEWLECGIPISGPGSFENRALQGLGSSLTFLRRYLYAAALNLSADEDDDGNLAAGNHIEDRRERGGRGKDWERRPDNRRQGQQQERQQPQYRDGGTAEGGQVKRTDEKGNHLLPEDRREPGEEAPTLPWAEMDWPIMDATGRCADAKNPDAWAAELQKRARNILDRSTLDAAQKRGLLAQMRDKQAPILEWLRKRGGDQPVVDCEGWFARQLNELAGA